jgi:hypothetical protein
MRLTSEDTEDTEDTEEMLALTPFGLISIYLDEYDAKRVADQIELYFRRNHCGMAIDDNKLSFVKLAEVGNE